jgi:hypothetical protein
VGEFDRPRLGEFEVTVRDLGAIMHAGGWKSPEMVMRYIEHMDVQKSGMARLYRKSPP